VAGGTKAAGTTVVPKRHDIFVALIKLVVEVTSTGVPPLSGPAPGWALATPYVTALLQVVNGTVS